MTGTGKKHRVIPLLPIVEALGPSKLAALPAFHALSGADNTGSFAGKVKVTCWKVFQEASEEIYEAMANLGTNVTPSEETFSELEKFVCQLYLPSKMISKEGDLRWFLFKQKKAQSEKLPPTGGALREAILRAHYQLMMWNNDILPNPEVPSPEGYGWKFEENQWAPTMTNQLPAPDAVIHLTKCGCRKTKCSSSQCHCRKLGLNCTELCTCSDVGDECDNMDHVNEATESESEDESNFDM